MQYRWLISVLVLFLMGNVVKAQVVIPQKKIDSLGTVRIVQDERINLLLKTDSIINSHNRSFTGYRVQIFSGGSTDKEKAFEIKKDFKELFPEVRAYVIYAAPDFRVRVGNFRSKIESIELYKECQKYFSNCYPVKTKITFDDLEPIKESTEELIVDEKIKE